MNSDSTITKNSGKRSAACRRGSDTLLEATVLLGKTKFLRFNVTFWVHVYVFAYVFLR